MITAELGSAVETMAATGFAVVRGFRSTGEVTAIYDATLADLPESQRGCLTEKDFQYDKWGGLDTIPLIDDVAADVSDGFHRGGFPDWTPTEITLRDTLSGIPYHPDGTAYRWGSAFLYLKGSTHMLLGDADPKAKQHGVIVQPGDILFYRQASCIKDADNSGHGDFRTRHGANLLFFNGKPRQRAFMFLGYVTCGGTYSYSIKNHSAMVQPDFQEN